MWFYILCLALGAVMASHDRGGAKRIDLPFIGDTLICAGIMYLGLWSLGIPLLVEMWPS